MLSAIADSINNTRKLLTEILKFWCLFFSCGVSNLVEMFCNSKKIISQHKAGLPQASTENDPFLLQQA